MNFGDEAATAWGSAEGRSLVGRHGQVVKTTGCSGMTRARTTIIGTSGESSNKALARRFYEEVRDLWRMKMKNAGNPARKLSRVTVSSGSVDAIREKPAPVSELAATLGRDRKAVKRDVALLDSVGLGLLPRSIDWWRRSDRRAEPITPPTPYPRSGPHAHRSHPTHRSRTPA